MAITGIYQTREVKDDEIKINGEITYSDGYHIDFSVTVEDENAALLITLALGTLDNLIQLGTYDSDNVEEAIKYTNDILLDFPILDKDYLGEFLTAAMEA
jgi:hypothetical protein